MPPELNFSHETQDLLARLSVNLTRNTLSHALLFYGLSTSSMGPLMARISQMILCQDRITPPCGHCQSCLLSSIHGHPDYTELAPEKKRSAIKIDSIRDLTPVVYTSPQLGLRRVVLIRSAEQMNQAASNALLKLLEEPPQNVYFILQATQLSALLPTLLSRCQLWKISDNHFEQSAWESFVAISKEQDPELAAMIEQLPILFQDLDSLLSEKNQVCTIATKWGVHELFDLATVLYFMNTLMISQQLGLGDSAIFSRFKLPSKSVSVMVLFQQLDTLNQLFKQLNQGIAMNAVLTIESFLLAYFKD